MNYNWKQLELELLKLLNEAIQENSESACQLAIYQHQQLKLNICAGHDADGRKITVNTQFPVFSVGKGIVVTAFHQLVEKQLISYDDRVADYWPEFACHGKENLLVWQVLAHRAGIPELPANHTIEELADWDLICRRIAEQLPTYTPGTKQIYHAQSLGYLLGEIARRATGQSLQQNIQENILQALAIKTGFWSNNAANEKRFLFLDSSEFPGQKLWHTELMHNRKLRQAFIPSSNAVTNAEALARIYAALLGEVDGVQLLQPETIDKATKLCRAADDPLPPGDFWAKFGLGYVLGGAPGLEGRLFGHGGAAGSEGFAFKDASLAVGFVKNRIKITHPIHPLRDQISQLLGLPIRHW